MGERGQPFGFSDQWFVLGLVTDELLAELRTKWARGEDPNPEHYRYRAFKRFLAAHWPLVPELAAQLYDLGATDPNQVLGGALMAHIVALPECPPEVRARALASEYQHLVKLASRVEWLRELEGGLTAELFERGMTSRDVAVQRRLVELDGLSRDQVEQLAEAGASRAVRNLARVRLRTGRYLD